MKFLKPISFILIFCLTFLIFLPKQNIYYLAEQELKKHNVILSNEKFTSLLFGFKLEDALLYVNGVNIAKLDKVDISFFKGISILSKSIGVAKTGINIANKSVVINFEPTKTFIKKYKIALKYFKKEKDGVYRYEYKLF
jgi:hypothetical protein